MIRIRIRRPSVDIRIRILNTDTNPVTKKTHLKIVPVTKEYYSILNYIFQLAPFGIKLGYFFPTNHFFKTIQQLYKNYSKLQAEYRKRLNPDTNSDLGWIRGSVYDE